MTDCGFCKICQHADEVDRVIKALGHAWAYVTEDSTVSDFEPSDAELISMREALGCEVGRSDYIWEVAERLKAGA